jgi:hypothetical protein
VLPANSHRQYRPSQPNRFHAVALYYLYVVPSVQQGHPQGVQLWCLLFPRRFRSMMIQRQSNQDKNSDMNLPEVADHDIPNKPPHRHLQRMITRGTISDPVDYSSFICGIGAGVIQAGIFNPYDRALYLSVKDHRAFLHIENWKSPYSGFFQSIGSRALSGGIYFPVEHLFLRLSTYRCTSVLSVLSSS